MGTTTTTKKGTKKNNVTLREKILSNENISLYLDMYINGKRSYEFLKIYINSKPRTPIEREQNRQNRELAERIRTDKEYQLNNTIHGQINPQKQKILFYDFSERYINEYQKKDIRMIKASVRKFWEFLKLNKPSINKNTLRVTEINKPMIDDYLDYLQSKSKGEGASSFFKRFKKVLNRAVDEGIISVSPAKDVKCTVQEELTKDILTNDEIIKLSKTEIKSPEIKRAFLFCCSTGLRFVDVKDLKYKDIDFANGMLNKEQNKTGKNVILSLNKTATKIIGEKQAPDDNVFNLPSFNACNKAVGKWVKRAGIDKHITWHCSRHSFAMNVLNSPEKPNIKTVSSLLGHSSIKHTEKYTRAVDELKKNAINALPEYDF